MCDYSKIADLIFVLGLIIGFITFVFVINWLNYKDHKKAMARMYPRSKAH